MKRAKYILNGTHFKNKKDAENHVRDMLCMLEWDGEVADGNPSWDFLHQLIERHPDYVEKYGVGVEKFLVGRSYQKHIELNILRKDGT